MLKIQNVTKKFKTYKKQPGLWGMFKSLFHAKKIIKTAVDDISFEVKEGEIIGYIGANGAGKSTTIKMMTGILKPTSGEITINGVNPAIDRKKNAFNIGVIFGQRTQLWWDLPLVESYTILKEIYRVTDEDFKKRLDYFKEIFGLDEFIHSPVRVLSLGQRMKADIVASLLHNPKVLFLDEPTIGLDIKTKRNVREAIKKLNKEYNTTVILTTHDLEDIEQLSHRIIMIDKGKLLYEGTIDDIKDNFGFMKSAKFELREKIEPKDLKDLKFTYKEEDFEISTNGTVISVKFNKHKIEVSDIAGKILSKFKIKDFSVSEMPIEELVEQIYESN